MKFKGLLILILIISVLFVGCRQEPMEATVPVTTQPTEPPAPKAGLMLRQLADDEQDALALQKALEKLGYEVLVRDAENDQSKQNEQVGDLLEHGCEVLVVQPVMTSGLDVLVEQVKPTAVPLVILDHQPEQAVLELYNKLSFIGPDHAQAGTVQSQLLAQLPVNGDLNLDGKTSVLIIAGPEDHIDAQKRAEDFLKGMPADTHVIMETVTGEWTQDGGRSAAAQMLAKYGPDIEVMVTFDGAMALGAIEAIENGGWVPGQHLYLLTVGGSGAVHNEVALGRISGTAAPDAEARLAKLSELVTALTTDQPAEKLNLIDYTCYITILT